MGVTSLQAMVMPGGSQLGVKYTDVPNAPARPPKVPKQDGDVRTSGTGRIPGVEPSPVLVRRSCCNATMERRFDS